MRIIAGRFGSRRLKAPKGKNTRPSLDAVREALFNRVDVEACVVLDLFAGSGAVGLEALSRGATHVTFVEKDRAAIRCIEENAQALGCEGEITIFSQDVFRAIKRLKGPFDFIYADPPFEKGFLSKLLEALDQAGILASSGRLFVEEGSKVEEALPLENLEFIERRAYGRVQIREYRAR